MFRKDLRASALPVALLLLFATTALLAQEVTEAGPRSTWHYLWIGALVLLTMGKSVFGRHTSNLNDRTDRGVTFGRAERRTERRNGGRLEIGLSSQTAPHTPPPNEEFFFMGGNALPRRSDQTGGNQTYNAPSKPQAFRPGLLGETTGRGAMSMIPGANFVMTPIGLSGNPRGLNSGLYGLAKIDAGGGNLTSVGSNIGPLVAGIPYPGGGMGPGPAGGGPGPAAGAGEAKQDAKKEEAKKEEAKKNEQQAQQQQKLAQPAQNAQINNNTTVNAGGARTPAPFNGVAGPESDETTRAVIGAVSRTIAAGAGFVVDSVVQGVTSAVGAVTSTIAQQGVGGAIVTGLTAGANLAAGIPAAIGTGLAATGSLINAGVDRAGAFLSGVTARGIQGVSDLAATTTATLRTGLDSVGLGGLLPAPKTGDGAAPGPATKDTSTPATPPPTT